MKIKYHIVFILLACIAFSEIHAQTGVAKIAIASIGKSDIAGNDSIGVATFPVCTSHNYSCGQSRYLFIFTGSGNWDVASSWSDEVIPPDILPPEADIIIDHAENGDCILNIQQTITAGAGFIILPGKTFKVKAPLILEN